MYNSHGTIPTASAAAAAAAARHPPAAPGMPLTIAHSMLQMSGNGSQPLPPHLVSYPVEYPYDTRRLLAVQQAEELERQHLLRSFMNHGKDDEKMEEQILLRDAAMAAGTHQTNAAAWGAMPGMQGILGPGGVFGGVGMGLNVNPGGVPVPARSLDLKGLQQGKITGKNPLKERKGINSPSTTTKKRKVSNQKKIDNSDSESAQSPRANSRSSPKLDSNSDTEEKSCSSKSGSKKKKLLRRQLEQDEQDDGSTEMDEEPQNKRKRNSEKLALKRKTKMKKQQVTLSSYGGQRWFPSYERKWQEIKNKVCKSHPSLSSDEQELIARTLFSDITNAGQVVIMREGEGWSVGYNISGMRSGGTSTGIMPSSFPAMSSLSMNKKGGYPLMGFNGSRADSMMSEENS